jgi:hypothetical protein
MCAYLDTSFQHWMVGSRCTLFNDDWLIPSWLIQFLVTTSPNLPKTGCLLGCSDFLGRLL